MNLKKYSKSIVALIALGLVIAKEVGGIDLGFQAEQVWTFAIPVLTMMGVYQISNGPSA